MIYKVNWYFIDGHGEVIEAKDPKEFKFMHQLKRYINIHVHTFPAVVQRYEIVRE